MGFFTPKCPRCGGALQPTGYAAPYPSYRCKVCIEDARVKDEIAAMKKRIAELEAAKERT